MNQAGDLGEETDIYLPWERLPVRDLTPFSQDRSVPEAIDLEDSAGATLEVSVAAILIMMSLCLLVWYVELPLV